MIVVAEARAEVRFDGWDADGQPVGRPIRSPLIKCLATEESQAGNTFENAAFVLGEWGPDAHPDIYAGIGGVRKYQSASAVYLPDGGEVRACTSGAASKDGGKETFVVPTSRTCTCCRSFGRCTRRSCGTCQSGRRPTRGRCRPRRCTAAVSSRSPSRNWSRGRTAPSTRVRRAHTHYQVRLGRGDQAIALVAAHPQTVASAPLQQTGDPLTAARPHRLA